MVEIDDLEAVMKAAKSEDEKINELRDILAQSSRKLNVLVVGAAGVGKSSTINAVLAKDVAKIGDGVELQTQEIVKYDSAQLVLWDTPGFSDDQDGDGSQSRQLIAKLTEMDAGRRLIDIVLVVLDASSRDLGSVYDLLNNVIVPHIGRENADRILLGLNQADIAMKGRYWDYDRSEPEQQLVSFLQEKVRSIRERALEATGLTFSPFYYSAGRCEDGEQAKPYNLSVLLYSMLQAVPGEEQISAPKPVASVVTQPQVVTPQTKVDSLQVRDVASTVAVSSPQAEGCVQKAEAITPHGEAVETQAEGAIKSESDVAAPAKVDASAENTSGNAAQPRTPRRDDACSKATVSAPRTQTDRAAKGCAWKNEAGCIFVVVVVCLVAWLLSKK